MRIDVKDLLVAFSDKTVTTNQEDERNFIKVTFHKNKKFPYGEKKIYIEVVHTLTKKLLADYTITESTATFNRHTILVNEYDCSGKVAIWTDGHIVSKNGTWFEYIASRINVSRPVSMGDIRWYGGDSNNINMVDPNILDDIGVLY